MIAGVLVEISHKNVDRIFEYKVPKELEKDLKIGVRVLVPFGRQTIEGFVLEIKNTKETDKELREILSVVDQEVVLTDELLALGKEMKERTLAPLISCYQVMLPKALKAKAGSSVSIRYETIYRLSNVPLEESYPFKQQEILDYLKEKVSASKKELESFSPSSLKTLVGKGILLEEKKEKYRMTYQKREASIKTLTDDQKTVVKKVITSTPQNYLLYGVTGSGKTEVYMEIIDYYLKQGKSSIVLVPEISLTPQMIQRFQERFGDKIAAIHSGLNDGEKYDEWRRIVRGEVSIVIGARSAIFAPFSNLGVIIVDEEHSDSYKQSDSLPHYDAREIAKMRGEKHHCSVVFGSATPSLEIMARASKGVVSLLELPHRINGKSLPVVDIVDMNQEMKHARGHFSKPLIDLIQDRLDKKEQVILLLNRRGYSSFVTCKNCGFTFKCPNCDISLTYHKSSNTLRCHYCGYGEKVYTECPKCKEKSLSNLGVGTQKIEEELQKYFPSARVLRMDYDTTSRKGMHEEIIQSFKEGKYDILLGTQMVAKGLDFANVTLVGVLNADTSLNIPDFRSSEKTFSLLDQVAGRSGRSEKEGRVIIQTFNPDHYAISLTKHHDYPSFYQKEMDIRRRLKYPPYFYLCDIKVKGKDASYTFQEALKIKNSLEKNLPQMILLGPSTAGVFKVNNVYSYHIIIKYKQDGSLYPLLSKVLNHYQSNVKVGVDIDFNPSQIL